MRPFSRVKSRVTPLEKINVDTDQIVPKQFLKLVQRTGFGKYLFYDWRYRTDSNSGSVSPREDFVLNDPRYEGSAILVAGENFGCGSSREHAVWALEDYGFRVIMAPSFADIFYSNCFKNGILPIVLDREKVRVIMSFAGEVRVDLESRQIILSDYYNSDTGKNAQGNARNDGSTGADGHLTIQFEIEDHRRTILLEGLDEIAQTLMHEDAISEYEKNTAGLAGSIPPIKM